MKHGVGELIDELRSRGFAKLCGVVTDDLLQRFQGAGKRLAQHDSEPWPEATKWFIDGEWRPAHFAGEGESANYFDCLGRDDGFDSALEEFLATPTVGQLLDEVVGVERRTWFLQLRWAMPDTKEYLVHQDVYGELGLCVYLADHPDEHGAMALWPGSHRWPRFLEAMPLAMPGWVDGNLERVDGVAGDICVFFNKTWHGRTVARGTPRLVMLISFIPPGPFEKPRRLPESARGGLGVELRKVTDPAAARSVAAPPLHPPLSTWIELPENCVFDDGAARACREWAWGWSRKGVEGDSSDASPLESLRRFKSFVKQAMVSAVVPRALIDTVLGEFRDRAEQHGFSPRTLHYLSMCTAVWNGQFEEARVELSAWRDHPRDALSDSLGEELETLLLLHDAMGESGEVLRTAEPFLEGEDVEGVPQTAWSVLLLSLVQQGRFAEAARAHAEGYPLDPGDALLFHAVGRHLQYLALGSNLQPALQLIAEHKTPFAMPPDTAAAWHIYCGSWLLFTRMHEQGHVTVDVEIPRLGAHHQIQDLIEHFHGMLSHIAGLLDQRNVNDYRQRCLLELATRVAWPTLP